MAGGRNSRGRRTRRGQSSSSSSSSDSSDSRSSRSRSRNRSRSRRRTRTRTLSRSPSPPRPHLPPPLGQQGQPPLHGQNQVVDAIKNIVLNQYNTFKEAIEEHKEEVDEKLGKASVKFQSKPIEKQFEVNSGILALNRKIYRALKHRNVHKAKKLLKEQEKSLVRHEEDLIIADESEYGWLTVSKIRDKKFLKSSLVKQITKVDELIAKAKRRNGPPTQGYAKAPGQQVKPGPSGAGGQLQDQVITKRPERKSPEEILHDTAKRQRAGNCSFCHENGHWYRECPGFWQKVSQSRSSWQGSGPAKPPEENKKEG